MGDGSWIFWFSGTGNSLYAAKNLGAALGMELTQIRLAAPNVVVGGKGEKVGFVFPSYYCNLPRAVRNFVERLEIKAGTYVFAIVTMGGPGQGSVAAMRRVLKAKGVSLDYGRGLLMPANDVLLYNPAEPAKGEKMRSNVDKKLAEFAADINVERQLVKSHPIVMNRLFKNIEKLDAAFHVSEACTNCGLCEKICPVENIAVIDAKPKWLHKCEHCVACISRCPAEAINYGSKTLKRRRYRNPYIKADELMRK